MAFNEAVANARVELLRRGFKSMERPYMRDEARLKEAGQVNDLVQRFATAEMNGQPLGRATTAAVRKPISVHLRKGLAKADESSVQAVRSGIIDAVAGGYLVALSIDDANSAEVDSARTAAEIWSFWIPCIYTAYLRDATSTADSDINAAEATGASFLEEALSELNLGRGGRKVSAIGASYGKAGLVLRLGQSTTTPGEWVTDPPPEFLLTYANSWGLEDYPP